MIETSFTTPNKEDLLELIHRRTFEYLVELKKTNFLEYRKILQVQEITDQEVFNEYNKIERGIKL